MKEKVISLKVGNLAEGKKSLLPNVFSAVQMFMIEVSRNESFTE